MRYFTIPSGSPRAKNIGYSDCPTDEEMGYGSHSDDCPSCGWDLRECRCDYHEPQCEAGCDAPTADGSDFCTACTTKLNNMPEWAADAISEASYGPCEDCGDDEALGWHGPHQRRLCKSCGANEEMGQ